jgi:putative resolvase
MKLSSYAKRLGISSNSAWSMWKQGQLPGYQLPTGTVIVDPPEVRSTPVRTVAVYARVSSSENKDNLKRQAERLISWCNALEWPPSRRCSRGLGRELVMVTTADTAEDDLMGDVVASVTSFYARLYGHRGAKRKTEHALAALQQNGLIRESEARESH